MDKGDSAVPLNAHPVYLKVNVPQWAFILNSAPATAEM
jgi:hypothetical protein